MNNFSTFEEWRWQKEIQSDITIQGGYLEKQLIFNKACNGYLKAEFCKFGSYHLSIMDFQLDGPAVCDYSTEGESIGLFYNLSGSWIALNNNGKDQPIIPGQQTLYYTSGHQERLRLIPDNGHQKSLELNLSVDYFTNLLSGYSPLQEKFINTIASGEQRHIQMGISPMTLPMKWIINTILQCTRTGLMKRLFLEAKILELLMLHVEQAEVLGDSTISQFKNPSELDALHEAKSILEANLDNPPTIRVLAKMVGMNEFDLKKGFKNTFNTAIYRYVTGLKMEQAKEILQDGNKSITEVSQLMGYKNPQHFTAAFKKFYGTLPSKLKNL